MSSQTLTEDEVRRIFRDEAIVAEADLRVDVARAISRLVVRDQETTVDEKKLRARGNLQTSRGSRDRVVLGNYERKVGGDEIVKPGAVVEEYVNGGADLKAQVESESIVGGVYVNTIAGVYLRMAAWVDYLVWGGWGEADVSRVEIAGLMIRSYMAYAHATGIRGDRLQPAGGRFHDPHGDLRHAYGDVCVENSSRVALRRRENGELGWRTLRARCLQPSLTS